MNSICQLRSRFEAEVLCRNFEAKREEKKCPRESRDSYPCPTNEPGSEYDRDGSKHNILVTVSESNSAKGATNLGTTDIVKKKIGKNHLPLVSGGLLKHGSS